jgi:hypothetical protein
MTSQFRYRLFLAAALLVISLSSHAQRLDTQNCGNVLPQGVRTFEDLNSALPPSKRSPVLKDYLDCISKFRVPAAVGEAPAALAPSPDSGNPGGANAAQNALSNTQSESQFLGLNWGLGAGYAFGKGPRRVTASIVDNVVRVSSDVTNGPRVILEAHYYPEKITWNVGDFGWGPFAAVEAGAAGTTSSSGITGFGVGVMGGWKVASDSSSGFNLGVGYLWEGNVQTLGDGITANQPLPAGETQIRYKNQSVGAVILFFSWTFGSSIPSNASSSK